MHATEFVEWAKGVFFALLGPGIAVLIWKLSGFFSHAGQAVDRIADRSVLALEREATASERSATAAEKSASLIPTLDRIAQSQETMEQDRRGMAMTLRSMARQLKEIRDHFELGPEDDEKPDAATK